MKCDEYKLLIDRLMDGVSLEEEEALLNHVKHCEECSQEYKAIVSYKSITSDLHKVKPVLENKNEFIEELFDKLTDAEEATNSTKTFWLADSGFRKTVASLAAALVLFFMVQQTHDALQVKQLEEKVATKHIHTPYNQANEQSFIELFAKIETNRETRSQLSKYKMLLFKKSLLKFGSEYGYKQLKFSKTVIK